MPRLDASPTSRSDVLLFSLAILALATLLTGMALLGATKLAGYFYLASFLLGAPVMWRLDYGHAVMSPAICLYMLFLGGFSLVCAIQVATGASDASIFDYVARPWLGLLNGFFCLAWFRFRRDRLFRFIALIAAANAGVLIAVAVWQGIDLTSFGWSGGRAGGTTNPIPFSQLLFTSVGLMAIALAGYAKRTNPAVNLVATILLVLAGSGAVMLTATRGTLAAVPLLLLLLAFLYRDRFSDRAVLCIVLFLLSITVVLGILIARASPDGIFAIFDRDHSDGIRLQLWSLSWTLIQQAPLFGHGFNSIPAAFAGLTTNMPDHDLLFTFNHVHNQYLDILVKAGAVGAILFFGPTVVAAGSACLLARARPQRVYALAILWVAGAYSLFGLTNPYFAHANTVLQLGVYLGMLMWLIPAPQRSLREPDEKAA